MKVIQILPELESGGVERGTLELAGHLVRNGHESIVISGGGRMTDELERGGSRHITLPVGKKRLSSLLLVRPLRQLLAREQPDILHLRSRVPAWLAWLAWRGMPAATRPRLVTTIHGMHSVNRWSAIMTAGERVICVSDSVRRYAVENYPDVDPSVLRVIHRGIDPASHPHGSRPDDSWYESFAAAFPASTGRMWITLPGRITRLKGHEDFLRILDGMRDLPVHGIIAGGAHPRKTAYLEELRRRVTGLGLDSRVTITGTRSDLREILAASRVVLSLTRQPESFGRTTLEALSLGVPVVGYDHGGVAEQLELLLPGGLVPPGDTSAAAAVIRQFLDHPPEIPTGHPFTLDRMLHDTVGVYEELLATPRG